jgi:hypothetical protein
MTISLTALADEIGTLDAQIKALQSKLDGLKTKAKELGRDEITGKLFSVKVSKSIAATLDTAGLKKEFGQSWYDDHCKLAERTTVYIKPLPGALVELID